MDSTLTYPDLTLLSSSTAAAHAWRLRWRRVPKKMLLGAGVLHLLLSLLDLFPKPKP